MTAALAPARRPRVVALTPRQFDILRRMAHGQNQYEVAHDLGITRSGVVQALIQIRRKLGAATTPHAVLIAARLGLFDDGSAVGEVAA